VTIGPRRRFVADRGVTSDVPTWRIAAAGAAGVAFALGWGSGYIGGRSTTDAPATNPGRIVQMNEAAAAPSAVEAPKSPPVEPPVQAVEQHPTPGPSPEVHSDAVVPPAADHPVEHVATAPSDATVAAHPASFREIVVPPGTSLSALTHQYYGGIGSPRLMQRIRDLNPKIVDVDEIFAGDVLRLPPVEEQDRAHE
jgi:hypothetical protein